MHYKLLVCFIVLFTISFSCKKKTDDSTSVDNTENLQKAALKNIGENLILASYQNFTEKSNALRTACQSFVDAPSSSTLSHAQNTWYNAKRSWKRCEVFSFGPAEQLLISSSIDYIAINTTNIETNITTASTIDNNYIDSKPSSNKGLSAIEYLLFDRNDQTNIVTLFTSGSDVERRKDYLIGLCTNLQTQANTIYNEWNPDQKNYLQTFKENTGTQVSGSLSLLINGMIKTCDAIKTTKLGIPLGKTTGTITPLSVEAYYSTYSISCIKEYILCFQYILSGSGYGTMDGNGINTLLNDDDFKENTYTNVMTSIEANITNCDLVSIPLDEGASTSDVHAMNLYDSSNQLLILLKNELSSVMGVLVTFTDSDGD